jgi:hypothetical protein
MLGRAITTASCLVAACTVLSACSPSPASTPTATARTTASARAAHTPSATATPVPPGPFAVVVTNDQRTGTTYEVMLINDEAQIVAHATAALPALQPNQTLRNLPLVSVSDTKVYYLNGNTDVDALSPAGTTATTTQIPDGTSKEIAFAVDPENQMIAISEISEESDATTDTGEGYIQDLSNGANKGSLWDNDGSYALRWPAGWDGTSLIDYISGMEEQCGGPGCGVSPSYHVVDPTTGDASATVCQTPTSQPSYGTPNTTFTSASLDGLATAAGTACDVTLDSFDPNGRHTGETESIVAVDWTGTSTTFTQFPTNEGYGNTELYNCFLSADGSRMACTAGSNNALALLSSGGTITNTGHVYNSILGWIDATHLLVEVDSGDLGVLDPDTGVLTSVAVAQANEVSMAATLPGSL